jgi:hypothetical protein
MGFMLLLNAFTIGYQTNYMAKQKLDDEVPAGFRVVDIFFCVLFTCELSARYWVFGASMYWKKGWQWNVFDTVVVVFQIVDEMTLIFLTGSQIQKGVEDLGFFRMLRLGRIVRLIRMVRLIPELKSMVYLISASMHAFFWTGVLLSLLMYCMAVYFTEIGSKIARQLEQAEAAALTTSAPTAGGGDSQAEKAQKMWGDLSSSMMTLFASITGGDDWMNFTDILEGGNFYTGNVMVFAIYIAFATLVMLNLVTGVFVEGAQRIIKEDRDSELVKHVYKLFQIADQDHSAEISWQEFEEHLQDKAMDEYFKAIDLSRRDAQQLFKLLDTDQSGTISVEEFVRGCLRLKGPARSVDLAALVYDFNVRSANAEDQFSLVEAQLSMLNKMVMGIGSKLSLALASHRASHHLQADSVLV